MSAPKLILFDIDGTLLDSKATIITSMKDAYAAVGLPDPDPHAVQSIIGLSLLEAVQKISPDLNVRTAEAVVEAYRATFVSRRTKGEGESGVPLFDGALETLHRLNDQPGYVLGAATGKAMRGLNVLIEAHNLHGIFMTRQTADLHPSKPHPAMIQAACAETGIAPEQAVMIGDTTFDMDMGRAAGCKTIAVSWGYHPLEELASRAHRVVDTFQSIDGAIRHVFGERS